MKIEQINKQILEINLPKEQKDAVLALIDLKTENEMGKALMRFEAAISRLSADMDAKFSAMDSKFIAIDSKFAAIDNKFTSQFNFLKWIIGGIGAFIACLGILITVLKFIG